MGREWNKKGKRNGEEALKRGNGETGKSAEKEMREERVGDGKRESGNRDAQGGGGEQRCIG